MSIWYTPDHQFVDIIELKNEKEQLEIENERLRNEVYQLRQELQSINSTCIWARTLDEDQWYSVISSIEDTTTPFVDD